MKKVESVSESADPTVAVATFAPGDVVRHRMLGFRGVVFDVDPVFANSDDWYEAIPAGMRPAKDQPFYHLFAENDEASYIAYVSQQNLLPDGASGPVEHPAIAQLFEAYDNGRYTMRPSLRH